MKYFNRHEVMSMDTLSEIGDIQREFYSIEVEASKFSLTNMLCGLYDGFDYTEKILDNALYKELEEKYPKLALRISKVLLEISTYPKYDHMVTQV